jgi:hypothetical protein
MTSTISPVNITDAVGPARLAQARSDGPVPFTCPLLTGPRLNAKEYYGDGRLAPYEESFPFGDDKDVRFISVSFWHGQDSAVRPPVIKMASRADQQGIDILLPDLLEKKSCPSPGA